MKDIKIKRVGKLWYKGKEIIGPRTALEELGIKKYRKILMEKINVYHK